MASVIKYHRRGTLKVGHNMSYIMTTAMDSTIGAMKIDFAI